MESIVSDSYHPDAADAYLADSGVSVWAIVGYWKVVDHDIDRVAADYQIGAESVRAALAYYEDHQGAIDARLEANRSALAA